MKASAKSHLTKRLGDLPWKVRGKAKRVPNNSIFERRVTLLMSKRSAICVLLRTAQCLFQNLELCCEVENSSVIKDVLTYPMPFSSALYCVYPLLMGSSSGSRYLLKHNTPHQAKKHRRQSGKQETRYLVEHQDTSLICPYSHTKGIWGGNPKGRAGKEGYGVWRTRENKSETLKKESAKSFVIADLDSDNAVAAAAALSPTP
ncbi:hypothetical protein MJG53_009160 [Ovis ammon polii x Ovis aries]|uniref:Uncharacterized protein n=1 Tax=Ovis ammon polii x Ovis aries TaxID=2918886 RepID=A0ACB9UZ22_9CETA|nr:hypothetical protein MJG53_009160 [Ovis ammon polii x Ovis aries]